MENAKLYNVNDDGMLVTRVELGGKMKRQIFTLLLVFVLLPLLANPAWDSALTLRKNSNIEWTGSSVDFLDGSSMFVWSELSVIDRDIYAMHVLANGQNAWDVPLRITYLPGEQNYPQLLKISETDVIVFFFDYSSSSYGEDRIGAQRINRDMGLVWPSDITVAGEITDWQRKIDVHLIGADVYCMWNSHTTATHIFGQKMSIAGYKYWGDNGRQLTFENSYEYLHSFLPLGTNEFALVFGKTILGQVEQVYLQRYNTEGIAQNPSPVLALDTPFGLGYYDAVYDGEIKLLLGKEYPTELVLVRFNSILEPISVPTVITNDLPESFLITAKLIPTADNGYYVPLGMISNNTSNLYMCQLSNQGQLVTGPTLILAAPGENRKYKFIPDGQNGVFCAWDSNDFYATFNSKVGSARIGPEMNLLWLSEELESGYNILQSISMMNGSYRMAWEFANARSAGIGIQNVSISGSNAYPTEGNSVCSGLNGELYLTSLKMFCSAENKLAFWTEWSPGGLGSLYYQVFDSNGNALLEQNGRFVAFCDLRYKAIQTPEGNVALVWKYCDPDGIRSISAQMFNPAGVPLWGDSPVILYQGIDGFQDPLISYSDGAVLCAWGMGNISMDVYVQKIVDGNLQWGNGLIVTDGLQTTGLSLKGLQGLYVIVEVLSFEDYTQTIEVVKLNSDGTPAWNPPSIQLLQSANSWYTAQYCSDSTLHNDNLYALIQDIDEDYLPRTYLQGITSTGELIAGQAGVPFFHDLPGEAYEAGIISNGSNLIVSAFYNPGNGLPQNHGILAAYDENLTPVWDNFHTISDLIVTPPTPVVSLFDNGAIYSTYAKLDGWYFDGLYYQLTNPNGSVLVAETPIWHRPGIIVSNLAAETDGSDLYVAWDSYTGRRYKNQFGNDWDLTGLYVSKYDFGTIENQDEYLTPPQSTLLAQNYPNPFNPTTAIKYSVADAGKVMIDVYNLKGQRVKTLIDEHKAPGTYSVTWDATDNNGKPMSSGVYFYRLRTGKHSTTKKMILMK